MGRKKTGTSRREFLATTAKSAAIAASLPGLNRTILGANDRIRIGAIGPGVRGQSVMQHFLKDSNVEFVALCDIYDVNLAKAQTIAGGKAQVHADYRDLLDQKEIDAVLIATPDHWHRDMAVDACNAGKDVYIEKPLTFEVSEGLEIIRATRLNDRVMQVGMQQRSGLHYEEAKSKYFDTGRLGKVTIARTWWHGNSYHLRKAPFTERPAGLDWNAFLGPRPWRDWDVQQFWNWRAYLDFGGGQITDLFTHWIDVVQWFMKEDLPTSAVAVGGVYNYKDGRTAPDTIHVLLEYPSGWTATFEATLAPGVKGAGIEFIGTDGRLEITRGGYTFTPIEGEPEERSVEPGDIMTLAHVQDFLDAVRTRRRPNGDVLHGHRSAQSSHLGNIAYLERKRIEFDGIREQIIQD
ncbi:MAG: Gfo/Idh/MocA family oxidoreductase [Acidobacteriota bacterium]|nr:MAG: Gfo/Idh/MocA family oxidoreductase [Acidobacteriota bacterium]